MFEIKKILVPIDFSENSAKVVDFACDLAGKLKADLSIVHVVPSLQAYEGFVIPHISMGEFEEDMQKSAQAKMDDFVEEHIPSSETYTNRVEVGDVADTIKYIADEEGFDLIVMGTHVAERVVKTSSCPVLTINPYKLKGSQ